MEEAEQLCDRLVIMDQGRIVAEGSPRSRIDRYSTREVVELRYTSAEAQQAAFARVPALVESNGAERIESLADRLLIYTDHGDATAAQLGEGGEGGEGSTDDDDRGDGLHASVLVRRSSLEDVFLRLTGRTLED
jgi:lipooligosaccharide transport system ATP-binding protein